MAETNEDLYLAKVHPSLNAKTLRSAFLHKWKEIVVPTNAGWTTSNAGNGAVTQSPSYIVPSTSTTASSRGLGYCPSHGLNSGDITARYVNWTKIIELHCVIERFNSDSEAVARFQLKEALTEGILGERGIGISIENYAVTGEAYGTARGTVSLGTLTDSRIWRIRIIKFADRVEFWVNGILTGTVTGTGVPSVAGTAVAYLVASIINGTTGGVDGNLRVSNIRIMQEW